MIPAVAGEFDPPFARYADDPARAFDFWLGEWNVNLRVKQKDGTWADERTATAKIFPVLGGRAVLELWDENRAGTDAIRGFSLRYYDDDAGEWKLYLNWPGYNRSGISGLTGNFRHGRGEFFSERALDDTTTLLSRYTFSDITENSLRWDDAFSTDSGKTWTNNWIMEFTRTADSASWPAPGEKAHTYYDGGRCDLPEFAALDGMAGDWTSASSAGGPASSVRTLEVLDGCAVLTLLKTTRRGEPFENWGSSVSIRTRGSTSTRHFRARRVPVSRVTSADRRRTRSCCSRRGRRPTGGATRFGRAETPSC